MARAFRGDPELVEHVSEVSKVTVGEFIENVRDERRRALLHVPEYGLTRGRQCMPKEPPVRGVLLSPDKLLLDEALDESRDV